MQQRLASSPSPAGGAAPLARPVSFAAGTSADPTPTGSTAAPSPDRHWSKSTEQGKLLESANIKKLAAARGFTGKDAWRRCVEAWDKQQGNIYSTASPHYRKCIFRYGFLKTKGNICKNASTCPRCRARADFEAGRPLPAR